MPTLLAVAIASALGGLTRYVLGGWIARPGPFPWETLAINASGSFLLGLLFTLFVDVIAASAALRAAVLIGFLGSYTTFSTFSLETFRLLEHGAGWLALANVAASVVTCLLGVYAGIVLARALA